MGSQVIDVFLVGHESVGSSKKDLDIWYRLNMAQATDSCGRGSNIQSTHHSPQGSAGGTSNRAERGAGMARNPDEDQGLTEIRAMFNGSKA